MQRVAIIGLGNFGYYLGRELFLKDHDVIGLDTNEEAVQKAKDVLSQAVLADASDKETLLALGIDRVDLAVITIGTNMLASILTALHLKEIGVKRIYAKALSEEHGRLLRLIGADDVLFPEKDLAINLARRIDNPNLLEYLPYVEGYSIFEMEAPPAFINKTLRSLDLINQYGVQILAIRQQRGQLPFFIPTGDYQFREHDVLTLLGPTKVIERLSRESSQ
jgi:trk system potassium uptake protein TrkA